MGRSDHVSVPFRWTILLTMIWNIPHSICLVHNIYTSVSKEKAYYKFIPSIKERLEKDWVLPERWTTCFITEHGNFGAYFERFKIRENGDYTCGELDSPRHVLMECEKYSDVAEEFRRLVSTSNLNESSWLDKKYYHVFKKTVVSVLQAKELTEQIERGEILIEEI